MIGVPRVTQLIVRCYQNSEKIAETHALRLFIHVAITASAERRNQDTFVELFRGFHMARAWTLICDELHAQNVSKREKVQQSFLKKIDHSDKLNTP